MYSRKMLEVLSNKVRAGEPVSLSEALAVIKYQENLRREREARSVIGRLKRWYAAIRARVMK